MILRICPDCKGLIESVVHVICPHCGATLPPITEQSSENADDGPTQPSDTPSDMDPPMLTREQAITFYQKEFVTLAKLEKGSRSIIGAAQFIGKWCKNNKALVVCLNQIMAYTFLLIERAANYQQMLKFFLDEPEGEADDAQH